MERATAAGKASRSTSLPNGGNVIRRHNEVRDVAGQSASMAYSHVTPEPVVREQGTRLGLVAWCVVAWCVIWQWEECGIHRRKCCLILKSSTRMPTPMSTALSGPSWSLQQQWRGASTRKRAWIAEPTSLHLCAQRTERSIDHERQHFLKRLAAHLATTWDMTYSRVVSFVHQRMSTALLRASTHCWLPGENSFADPWMLKSCDGSCRVHTYTTSTQSAFHSWKSSVPWCGCQTHQIITCSVPSTQRITTYNEPPPLMTIANNDWVFLQIERVFNTHAHTHTHTHTHTHACTHTHTHTHTHARTHIQIFVSLHCFTHRSFVPSYFKMKLLLYMFSSRHGNAWEEWVLCVVPQLSSLLQLKIRKSSLLFSVPLSARYSPTRSLEQKMDRLPLLL